MSSAHAQSKRMGWLKITPGYWKASPRLRKYTLKGATPKSDTCDGWFRISPIITSCACWEKLALYPLIQHHDSVCCRYRRYIPHSFNGTTRVDVCEGSTPSCTVSPVSCKFLGRFITLLIGAPFGETVTLYLKLKIRSQGSAYGREQR